VSIAPLIDRLLAGQDLGREGAAEALDRIMSGEVDPVQTGAFLVALRAKGERADELAGLAEVIRRRSERVVARPPLVDTCGTGGGVSTFNVSTAAAFVAAGAGARVAKHGNRSATSRCGSADVLEALGARIDLGPGAVGACVDDVGIGFMFAPRHHPAFRHVAPVRAALGVRTIFNMIGPLANPAGATRQVVGVVDPAYVRRMAEALAELGAERALVVHGEDGMDEISTAAPTRVVEIDGGELREWRIDPGRLGLAAPANGTLAGGEPAENAARIRSVLGGAPGPAADVVAVNAAAAIWIAGGADSLAQGLEAAREALAGGAAAGRLEAFVAATLVLAPEAESG